MRTLTINPVLERALSAPRLGRYMADSGGLLDAALSLYERNARMSEAFYRPLQSLEVCLRNRLHERLTTQYGTNWFKNGGPQFHASDEDRLKEAMASLRRDGLPITPGAVVAELNFGFWVSILARRYDNTIWRSTLAPAFAEDGKRMGRQRVHNRMDAIRNFRNRVFHHEPIYHLNPAQMHDDIIAAIGWMCVDSSAWALHHSRAPYVLANPWPA